ncbi:cation:proton antiporter domain-containing protein [Pseudomonas fluorescens]|uniref:cation:proton antiporter domain-containing protein n=1 Tax=Pseudomonas fluorescens TaxID=294 RepID=UPI0012495161|nr:cation:proton antiporter [Pseudomonas fluorescens]CAG8872926.1 hypothetical protein PS861_05441 [Pseudomonas fluorescens]
MQTAYTVLILLMLVGVSRLIGRVVPLQLPLVQIAAGALLAWPTLGLHVALDPELFLFLFLPPLLFSDGWRMPKREFWHLRGPILTLAVGLVLFTVVGAGYFIHWLLPGVPLPVAFALAAVLSPTDAVAVSAISRNRLPTPLMHILQGESLYPLYDLRTDTIKPLCLLPFAAYVLAERMEVSGILSAVAAGMMQSWLDLLPRQTNTRLLNRSVWSLLEFAFNGLIFLLLGLQLPDIIKAVASHETSLWPTLLYRGLDVVAIFLVLLALRFVWVQSIWRLSVLLRRMRGKGEVTRVPTARSCWLLTIGGVRGAVTLAGVMSVPMLMGASAFPERDLLIFIAAGVILLSLIAACIALPLLLRGIEASPDDKRRNEVRDAWRKTAEAAIHALETEEVNPQDAAQSALAAELKARIMSEYRHQLEVFNDSAEAQALAFQMELLERRLRLKALRAQRLELYSLSRHHQIGDDVLREVLGELDLSEAKLGQVK